MHIERLPSVRPSPPPRITGNALGANVHHTFEVVGTRRLSLEVVFTAEPLPAPGEELSDVMVSVHGALEVLDLGRCRFEVAGPRPRDDSRSEPPPRSSRLGPGAVGPHAAPSPSPTVPELAGSRGWLIPIEAPLDCEQLFRNGRRAPIADTFDQLPLFLSRKELILPEFQRFTSNLVYDLRIYRALLDDIDAGLAAEDEPARGILERAAIIEPGQQFMRFIEEKTAELEELVRSFSRQDHERHGFYFRRQLWDAILSAPILERTNLRPRGYAGDWVMMQLIYQNDYIGSSLFGKLLHKSSIETAASRAVRDRRRIIAGALAAARREREATLGARQPLRFLSIACGPACELEDIFHSEADAAAYECALLDQDEEALREAARVIEGVEQRIGARLHTRFIHQSVRTMLREPRFVEVFGRHQLVYSMGLFDYLTAPVAKAVLRRLYELIEPGGQLIVGNYHVSNPTRWYMEYWADWALIYRTEGDLLALAAKLPGASYSITFDESGSQMFLSVRKAER